MTPATSFWQRSVVGSGPIRLLAILLLALVTTACERAKVFESIDVTGAPFGSDFSLVDHNGERRTLADYRGKVVVVFFGFTHCPDVCPTQLSVLAQAKELLGKDGQRLQAVFITLDPARDTPQILAQYVPAFDPTFVGLTGTAEEIAATAKEFKIFYEKVAGKTEASYTLNHTAASYAFDPEGRLRLFVKHEQTPASIAADLKKLL